MARINIDDDVESRPEYRRLLKILEYNDDRALGMLVRFWRLAQRYWGDHKLVPPEEMEDWEFQPIIESKWAVLKEGGYYAKGSEERFAWYRQACDAGKKGGRPRKEVKPDETGANPTVYSDNPTVRPENLLVPVPVPALALAQIQENTITDLAIGAKLKLDFESLYQEYPRKDGKAEGLAICKAKIKTQGDYDRLLVAVRRYRAHCEREGTGKEFIKHFSSFMNKGRWKDWLDPDVGTAIETTPTSHIDWSKFT